MSLERPLTDFNLIADPVDARHRMSSQRRGWMTASGLAAMLRELLSFRGVRAKSAVDKTERREPFLLR